MNEISTKNGDESRNEYELPEKRHWDDNESTVRYTVCLTNIGRGPVSRMVDNRLLLQRPNVLSRENATLEADSG
jgi:hypothetical protein